MIVFDDPVSIDVRSAPKMAATPLAMVREYGYTYESAALVVQWHMFGMYSPSFFTGWLIGRFGLLNVLIAGLVLSGAFMVPPIR